MNRRSEILAFITQHNADKGYSPTIREIGKAVGLLSSSTVLGHIERLERDGLITYQPNMPRTIKVVQRPEQPSEIVILEKLNEIPIAIEWENRRYVLDPMG